MPSVTHTNFTAGEVSPLLLGRTDLAKYGNGAKTLKNVVVLPQGGVTRSPGTRFVVGTKNNSRARLVRFLTTQLQPRLVEIGDGYARFCAGDGQIVSGGAPVELAIPYALGQVDAIHFVQSGDELLFFHGQVRSQRLIRASDTAWSMTNIAWSDGPYLDQPKATATTLTPSAATGNPITITASAVDDINGGQGFLATDIGRFIRLRQDGVGIDAVLAIDFAGAGYAVNDTITLAGGTFDRPAVLKVLTVSGGAITSVEVTDRGSYSRTPDSQPLSQSATSGSGTAAGFTVVFGASWGNALIIGVTNITHVTAAVMSDFTDAEPTTQWRLGAWSDTTGWPYLAVFFQNRLIAFGTDTQPDTVWGGFAGDFFNFQPTLLNGAVTDDCAFTFTISEADETGSLPVNVARWLSPSGSAQTPQLGLGTAAAEFILQAGTAGGAVTPTSVQFYRESAEGARPDTNTLRIGKATIFVPRDGRGLNEWTYKWQEGGFSSQPLELLSEHLPIPSALAQPAGGIARIDYAKVPYSLIWALRDDGQLVTYTYQRDQDIVGGTRRVLGGDYYGGPPIVESLAVLPAADLTYDEWWLVVKRTIGGLVVRTIEKSTRPFRGQPVEQAFFVDCGLSSVLTRPAASCTPAWSQGSAVLAVGDSLDFAFNADVAESGDDTRRGGTWLRINGGVFVVNRYDGPRAIGAVCRVQPVNLAPAAAGAWSYDAAKTTFSGLDHLEGETVAILGDGAVYPRQAVAGGAVVLPYPASFATIGLPAELEVEPVPLEYPAADGESAGKVKRIDHVYLRLFESGGFSYGPDAAHLQPVQPRSAADLMGSPPPLFTGVLRAEFTQPDDDTERFDATVLLHSDDPLPLTVLSIGTRAQTFDKSAPG